MDQTYPIAIHDDAKKPSGVTGARICLVEKSALGTETHPYPGLTATHSDAGAGALTASPV